MARSRIGVIMIMVVLAMITGVGVAYLFSPPDNLDAQSMPPGLAATAQQLAPLGSARAEQLAPLPTPSESQPEQPTVVIPPTVSIQPSATAAPPSPVEPTPAPPAPRVVEYTVQRGDILADIARQYGVSVQQILAVNAIENPDSLRVGQVLQIPQP